jgi:murein DD-endopeptidase MepM/ murein hydrolase activator NlpD
MLIVTIAVLWWMMAGLFDPPPAVWVWPVSGSPQVVRDFDAPESPWGAGHRGVDISAPSSALRAPVSGRVHFRGDVAGRGVVTIRTSEGWLVSMEPVVMDPAIGSRVAAGQRLGTIAPGHCARRCVHVGLRIDGDYHSPLRFFGFERRAVLVPWND